MGRNFDAVALIFKIFITFAPISLGVPLQAEIIPFEPEQVSTCGGTKMAACKIFPF